MSRRHHHPRRGGRTTPSSPRRRQAPVPPLVDEVAALLNESTPLHLFEFASALVESTRPSLADRFESTGQINSQELFASFVDSGFPELAALASVIATITSDELLESRVRLSGGLPAQPFWLGSISDIKVHRALVQEHIFGDGDNVVVGWRWASGKPATLVAFVDHNMGTIIKDAFTIDDDIASIEAAYNEVGEPGVSSTDLSLADAKSRLTEALETYDMALGMPETETWPVSRPLVEWITQQLPEGGTGYERPSWAEADREQLVRDFVGSPFAAVKGLTSEEVAELAEPLIWFACDYGPGDPLRWSPISTEIVLLDWYPRKVMGFPKKMLTKLPDVVAAFVEFSHDRTSIPSSMTAMTLDAVNACRSDFAAAISPAGSTNKVDLGREIDANHDAVMSTLVADLEATTIDYVGGADKYRNLDDKPLPDLAFDWAGVPPDMRELTDSTLSHLDQWAEELFDTEVRSLGRVVLQNVVEHDRSVFKRSDNTEALAAAILGFLFRRLTERMSKTECRDLPWEVSTITALAKRVGVSASTISNRSKTVANVIERSALDWAPLLHSMQRCEVLESKATIAAWRERDDFA